MLRQFPRYDFADISAIRTDSGGRRLYIAIRLHEAVLRLPKPDAANLFYAINARPEVLDEAIQQVQSERQHEGNQFDDIS